MNRRPPVVSRTNLMKEARELGWAATAALALAIGLVSVAPVRVAAQTSAVAPVKAASASRSWTAPRTPDGHPDLQGVWANNNATPLERPKSLAGRQFLTDAEVATLKTKAVELFNGDGDAAFGDSIFDAVFSKAQTFKSTDGGTGNYNQFWLVDRDFDNRTSLIVDPPDGRIPALTPGGQQRRAAAIAASQRPAEGPEARSLSERCITFGVPRLGAGYNSYYQIVQTPKFVVLHMETIHDARVIPVDGRPHLPKDVRLWMGDSVGHWEGDTLVVDTTNFSPKSNFRGSSEGLHTIERFTRVGPATLKYEISVDDPTTWTRPWTVMIPLKHTDDRIYEYACHEANIGLEGILKGTRTEEKDAEDAARRQTR